MNAVSDSTVAPELTVILCTHNPRAEYLEQALAALRAQTLTLERWELLVVDNASESPLAGRCDLTWHPRARIIREERLGLTMARIRGFRAAESDLLILVDDDNLLAPDYLLNALDLAARWPMLGAWGGRCLPRFESEPPAWTRKYWVHLGVRDFDRDLWSNVIGSGQPVPIGAGMCLRRIVAARYLAYLEANPQRATLDRASHRLMSCGDTDLALTACDMGMGTGMFTALELVHLMPARRLEESYLRELVHGITYSAAILGSFRGQFPCPLSRSQRALKWYESLRLEPREREFDAIIARAREEALADIPKFQIPANLA